ncbi:MAG: hypothetical protein KatS3mg090_0797 [Patescibacteria group bacterium]|nr:MAG: hypothetical protein KatS3mg090_0797 [Patescibacteria group bacterium]
MENKKSDFNNKINDLKKFVTENLTYIITGIIIILITVGVLYNYYKGYDAVQKKDTNQQQNETNTETNEKTSNQVNEYIVKRGDNLWKIAEEVYGSGYNAVDIAQANNLDNPNLLFAGQKLVLPKDVVDRTPTTDKVSSAKTEQRKANINEYTVKKGDHLWKIAQEVYGDGYAWTKIAKANNLSNPNILFTGQKLKIPQN